MCIRAIGLIRCVVVSGCRPVPCFHPLSAWRGPDRGPSGRRLLVFDASKAVGPELKIPCGQCVGCRLERSRQWAVRLMHESSLVDQSWFVTLTYRPDALPIGGSLCPRHMQLFLKRLRKQLGSFRYFQCGEYGDQFTRPHHHAVLFGIDFPDREHFTSRDAGPIYTSESLARCWRHGFVSIGAVTFESCAYVARYCLKKVTGKGAEDHYWSLDERTGELHRVEPEYITMSRGGKGGRGIGYEWIKRYGGEVLEHDSVISRGHEVKPGRYYDAYFEANHGPEFERVKRERRREALRFAANQTEDRLLVRETVAKAKLALGRRALQDW